MVSRKTFELADQFQVALTSEPPMSCMVGTYWSAKFEVWNRRVIGVAIQEAASWCEVPGWKLNLAMYDSTSVLWSIRSPLSVLSRVKVPKSAAPMKNQALSRAIGPPRVASKVVSLTSRSSPVKTKKSAGRGRLG